MLVHKSPSAADCSRLEKRTTTTPGTSWTLIFPKHLLPGTAEDRTKMGFLPQVVQHFSHSGVLKEHTEPKICRRVLGKSVNLPSNKLMIHITQDNRATGLFGFFFVSSSPLLLFVLWFYYLFSPQIFSTELPHYMTSNTVFKLCHTVIPC